MSESYQRDDVVKIINSVVHKVSTAHEPFQRDVVLKEVQELQTIIAEFRKGLGQARATDIQNKHIPDATDELDAVVDATASATGSILAACEQIETQLETTPSDTIADEVTKIYEACSFQDITGQRITNVVKTLKAIEEKVRSLLSTLGADAEHYEEEDVVEGDDDESLMNGPQLPGQGISQDEIDKLLEDFD